MATNNSINTTNINAGFQIRLTGNKTSVTGDGTAYTINFTGTTFDLGTDYNTITGMFTAPAAGNYIFGGMLRLLGLTVAHDFGIISIITSNRNYQKFYDAAYNDVSPTCTFICDMDAGDTAYMTIAIQNSTKTISIQSEPTGAKSNFYGYILK